MKITEEIKQAACNCLTVYKNASAFVPVLEHYNEEWIQSIDTLKDGKQIRRITIRGSDDPVDWLRNLDLKQRPVVPGFNASRGVIKSARTLLTGLIKHDFDFNDARPIQIEGHSKGGAVAQVLAVWLHDRGCKIDDVITFGCPRITRQAFEYPFPVTQISVAGDPVPFVPCWRPWRPFQWTWRHNGDWQKLGRRTMATESKEFFLIKRMISSHLMTNYCSVLGIKC